MIVIMKNVFLVIMVVLMFGCSKDSAETPPTNISTITDIDGNVYETVVIGNQTWMKSNLNVSKYQDGTPIEQVTTPADWVGLTTGAWCYYKNDPENGKLYGKLYNWYAVNDKRGLAPTGTSIPTDVEWTTLTKFIGSEAGEKMKHVDWSSDLKVANSSGFTALPGGICISNGDFYFIGEYGYWWSSTGRVTNVAWNRSLGYNSTIVCKSYDDRNYGFAVRCIKK